MRAREVIASTNFNKYIGLDKFTLKAINPTRKELNKILNTNLEPEIEYKSLSADGNPQIRLDMYFEKVLENENDFPYIHKTSLFLEDTMQLSQDGSKVKVINLYGNTAYIDIDHFKNKTLPENMKWFAQPYKKCFSGEENLVNFAKAYFNTPAPTKFNGVDYVPIEDLRNAEMEINDVKKLIQGDLTELQEFFVFKNEIKILVGIKTTPDNKTYQDTFKECFIKVNAHSYKYVEDALEEARKVGKYALTKFSFDKLHVYKENTQNVEIIQNTDNLNSTVEMPEDF